MENQQIIQKFYGAFSNKDYVTMGSLYHPQATFTDEAFVNLNASQVADMWEMLITRGTDLKLSFSDISTDGNTGKAHWDADYTFSKTGNKVHNSIDATFEFKDGLIFRHRDRFNFHLWSRQALGFVGLLLGWTSFLQNKVSQTAMQQLKKFSENKAKKQK